MNKEPGKIKNVDDYEAGYKDGFEDGKGVVVGTTDCIPHLEVEAAIVEEINIAHQEGQPTSRLTSLFNKLKEKE